jgi:predicted nucleic acid-binding Zn ribbon protein
VTGTGAAGVPAPEGSDLARAVVARARARTCSGPRGAGRRGRWDAAGAAAAVAGAVRGQSWSGAGADRRDPQALSDVVDGLVEASGWGEDLSVHAVLARWDLLVGRDLAAHCPVERVDAGRVVLRADSTAWATQVRLLVPTLLARLADELGAGVVTEVEVLGPAAPSWRHGSRRVSGRGPRDTYG